MAGNPAFDASVKTATGANGAANDSVTPTLGSLSLGGAIVTPTALSGTNGVDCKLIHGNRWQEIVGNETDTITGNLITTIDGNENRLLLNDLETTVFGKTKDDRFGTFLGDFYDISTFNYFHQRHENHTEIEQENQVTTHRELTEAVEKIENKHFDSTLWKAEAVGFFAGGTAIKIEAIGTGAEGFGAKVGMGGIEATGLGWRHKSEALESKLDALAAKVTGADVESGGPDTSIRPIFVGILVAVHIDSPFA